MFTETLRFGKFDLDVAGYELRRNGRAVKLERLPMELLLFLVERRGQLVGRQEIVQKLWGDNVFFDVDTGLNTVILKIRQALRDSADHPTYIQTVTGKGYRFIAPVLVVAPSDVMAEDPGSPARLKLLDEFEGLQQILSLANPPIELIGPPEKTPEVAIHANDCLTEICRKHPDRFPAFIASLLRSSQFFFNSATAIATSFPSMLRTSL